MPYLHDPQLMGHSVRTVASLVTNRSYDSGILCKRGALRTTSVLTGHIIPLCLGGA
jgi:hypothetical protein